MLTRIKDLLFGTADKLFYSGGVRILMYHGCCDGDAGLLNANGKHVEKRRLYEQLNGLIKKGWKAISLKQLHGFLHANQQLPRYAFLVTFDDGFASNYKIAYPILKALEIPSVIYVTTDFVDEGKPLWPDRVEYCLGTTLEQNVNCKVDGKWVSLMLRNDSDRLQAINKVKRSLKQMKEEDVLKDVEHLEKQLGRRLSIDSKEDVYKPLNWQQCKEMVDSGWVSIGAHTASHPILSTCSKQKAELEISKSKRIIETKLGQPCESFAYPNGGPSDYNDQTVKLLKEEGFNSSMTTINGRNGSGHDCFQLLRFGVNNFHSSGDLHTLFQESRRKVGDIVRGARSGA